MKKLLLFCSMGLMMSSIGFEGELKAQGQQALSPPIPIFIHVIGNPDSLQVTVTLYRASFSTGGRLEWRVTGNPNWLDSMEISVPPEKEAQCKGYKFPTIQYDQPSRTATSGPFDRTPDDLWCSYNIVLHLTTAQDDITIDPDYKVGP